MSTVLDSTRSRTAQPPNRGRRFLRRIYRGVLGLLITVATLTVLGALYQAIATARDARAFALPGQRVDVGTHKLHLNCTGPTSSGNPTVILESGLGGTSSTWAWILPAVASTTRVCAYDRAGMGWSDPASEPRDAEHIAEELHALLRNAGVAGPYVLVGWSFGGLYMRVFAGRYGADVAGVVLIDSSSPDQCTSTPAGEARCRTTERIYRLAPTLARIGVFRVMGLFQPASGLPEPQNSEVTASFSATKDWVAQRAEYLAWPATNAQVRASTLPVGVPLLVLTATDHGTPPDLEQLWQGWQADMTSLSTNSVHHVVTGASHSSLVFDAEDAVVTAEAILRVVEAAATGTPLASR